MTVADLIAFLEKKPRDLIVTHGMYSEQCLLLEENITVAEMGMPRGDGWVHYYRPDKPSQKYLVFPGN